MLKFTILLVNWFVGEIYAASSGCSTTGLTDSDRQVITNLHNNFRSSLAKGQEPTASGGNAPTAKNMYKIQYDCDLEGMAQSWANKCVFQHSGGNAGENLYMQTNNVAVSTALTNAADMWWAELAQYGGVTSSSTNFVFTDQTGHFTQDQLVMEIWGYVKSPAILKPKLLLLFNQLKPHPSLLLVHQPLLHRSLARTSNSTPTVLFGPPKAIATPALDGRPGWHKIAPKPAELAQILIQTLQISLLAPLNNQTKIVPISNRIPIVTHGLRLEFVLPHCPSIVKNHVAYVQQHFCR
uniref:SCP domain-containing protein n=1 Tax=Acrobeloides nanus TaxID=290746 RepID=A0A914CXD3_9BILA